MKEIIHIACAADNKYVQHTSVMLASLFENNRANEIHLHFFSADFTNENLEIISKFTLGYNQKFSFYKLEESLFLDCYISNHVSYATYYRVVIPNQLVSITDKVLYLDTDMIICQNLLPLWHTNLSNYVIAAANEPSFSEFERMNIPKEFGYFNAGVLLINTMLWVEKNLTKQLFEFIKLNQNKLTFWDQDALNANLFSMRLRLEPKWNQQSAFFELDKTTLLKNYPGDELNNAETNPAIIHFTGSSKPWEYLNFHPYKSYYYKYLELTRWKGFQPDSNLKDKFKYLAIKLIGKKLYARFFALLGLIE